jgi:hypothetical protein
MPDLPARAATPAAVALTEDATVPDVSSAEDRSGLSV